ncbi:TIGR02300 family protein [Xanthobacter autotrophicus]|uniref:TIGR02300 family protein n=1 Tax=Xanthobacter autotrophicus TaxID=280 RepID=A0A6C1KG65_XANAU|nr:TIGR02300 family protein [Xanthobacter autotrophicus]MDI4657256.1 TIGR02300 family protein [Xanthobacter autotrophicus]TLX43242.1 TIGR02300 family protein [Xanthobacter autotrophicus]
MAKAELGTKRICPVTGRKFYDLNKDPVVSPFTGESYPRSYFEPAVRGSSRAEPRGAVEEVEAEDTEAEVISLEEADEEAAAPAKVVVGDDVDVDDDIEAGDDDTFLEEDEDDGDDVSDLIGEGLEDDEEA